MSNTPFRFDDSDTIATRANTLLAAGITQASLDAQQKAARGDVSQSLVGIGPNPTRTNPLNLSAPLPQFQQPNPAPVPTTAAPPPSRPVPNVTTNYIQPNTANPTPNPPGVVSKSNPMGL